MQQKRRKSNRRKGFTLIEIMLVIGIIAMLAVFVVPNFMNQDDKAKRQTAEALVQKNGRLATAIKLFRKDMGRYPEELSELVEDPGVDEEEGNAEWLGPYIEDLESLKDPWGIDLSYESGDDVTNEGSYDLCSAGPDKDHDTDDDICNYNKE